MKTVTSVLLASLAVLFAVPVDSAPVPQGPTRNVNADESIVARPLAKIDEASVKQTVSFLSSDEMAGRDTPSPELERAAEYVASRFKQAGLTGGATDGSY